jgi:hypothetical protein
LPIQVIAISASVFIRCGCLICRALFHKRQAVADGVDLGPLDAKNKCAAAVIARGYNTSAR